MMTDESNGPTVPSAAELDPMDPEEKLEEVEYLIENIDELATWHQEYLTELRSHLQRRIRLQSDLNDLETAKDLIDGVIETKKQKNDTEGHVWEEAVKTREVINECIAQKKSELEDTRCQKR